MQHTLMSADVAHSGVIHMDIVRTCMSLPMLYEFDLMHCRCIHVNSEKVHDVSLKKLHIVLPDKGLHLLILLLYLLWGQSSWLGRSRWGGWVGGNRGVSAQTHPPPLKLLLEAWPDSIQRLCLCVSILRKIKAR